MRIACMRHGQYVFFAFIVLMGSVLGKAQEPVPADVLQSARNKLLSDMGRQPRYTCTQNIARQFYRSNSKKPKSCAEIDSQENRKHDLHLVSWDHLQLDVAIADNREIHAWPGTSGFAEDEIRELVGNEGLLGGGDFAGFVIGVFGNGASVKFEHTRSINGRKFFEYSFDVPQSVSNYQIAHWGTVIPTAYIGSFLLDAKTGDLAELLVRTAKLPIDTQTCQAVSKIEYGRTSIHGNDVLIPSKTELRIIYRDGGEASGATTYSNCHEYNGKSKLQFDTTKSTGPADPAADPLPAKSIPVGLRFDCRIVTPIDSETAAGQPIEGVLLSPLQYDDGTVIASSGAHIVGRIVHLQAHVGKADYFEVGVRLDTVEVNGSMLPLYASLGRQAEPPKGSFENGDYIKFSELPNLPRNVGVFFFLGKKLRVQQWDSTWFTHVPDHRKTNPTAIPAQAP